MVRSYRRDKNGRFAGGISTAPRAIKTGLAKSVAPRGTISKRKNARANNRDFYGDMKPGERVREKVGGTSPWIMRERPRRLPGRPQAPSRIGKRLDDSYGAAGGKTRNSRRLPRRAMKAR